MRIKSEHTNAGQHSRLGFLRRGWRKMTWALIGWSALVVIGGLALSGHTANKLHTQCQHALVDGSICQQVGSQAASDQFQHIMKIGLAGFAVLAVIWFMTRPRQQSVLGEIDGPGNHEEAITNVQRAAPSRSPKLIARPVAPNPAAQPASSPPRPKRGASGQLPMVVLGLLAATGLAVGGLAAAGTFSHPTPARIITKVIKAHTAASRTPAATQLPAAQPVSQPQPAATASSSYGSGITPCGGDLSVGPNTSCGFAENVESAYGQTTGGDQVVTAYSPANGQTYMIACSDGVPHVCTGGSTHDASVYFTSGPTSAPAARAASAGAQSACDSDVSVNSVTSCPFAANVFQAYAQQYQANGPQTIMTVRAYSPVTHLTYDMTCVSNGSTVNCTGGKGSFLSFPVQAAQDY